MTIPMTPTQKVAVGGGITAAVMGILMLIIPPFEGFEPKVAPDPIGVPTYCYGETLDIPPLGTVFTESECRGKLAARLPQYERGMAACIKDPYKVPDKSYAAFISFTYNVGVGAFCSSTLHRLLNAGDLRGACEQLTRWVYADGRVFPGLVTRRNAEKKLCLEGIT